MRLLSTLTLTGTLAIATPALAAPVFFDGFEGDTPSLSLTSTLNFVAATSNTIDVVAASNPYGITVSGPASGNVVHIDGTLGTGALISKATFDYNAGDLVTLSFALGGAQRGSAPDLFLAGMLFGPVPASVTDVQRTGYFFTAGYDAVNNGIVGATFLGGHAAFANSSISFRALTGGNLRLLFAAPSNAFSNDFVGPLLDNVSLDISAVPEPSTWAMMILGIGVIGGALRRRVRQSVNCSFT